MPDLASTGGRDALKWLFFCYGTIHPIWIRLFFPQRIAGNGDHDVVTQLATEDLHRNYGLLAEALKKHPYLAGEALSPADLYVAATLHWEAKVGGRLTQKYPELAELKSRVMSKPAVKDAFAGEIFEPEPVS